MPCMPTWNPKSAYVFLATSRILGWDYVEATVSGQTRADRAGTETIRGMLSAPADFQKKESCCVIPGKAVQRRSN